MKCSKYTSTNVNQQHGTIKFSESTNLHIKSYKENLNYENLDYENLDCEKHSMYSAISRSICVMLAALYLALQPTLAAAYCTSIMATPISFGQYEVFSPLANTSGVGTVTVNCNGSDTAPNVSLSSGQSGSFTIRSMNGADTQMMQYNLYTNASRTVVWGDGTGISATVGVNNNSSTTLTIYGQIFSGQDLSVGSYFDNITVSINF